MSYFYCSRSLLENSKNHRYIIFFVFLPTSLHHFLTSCSIKTVVQSSATDLTQLVADLEENADFLTSLALFRFKSFDKKVCFVGGLALLFKVLY